ncbi:MAG: hypothetical protein QOJ75_1505, partial [Chloroflexota bacterium]|nr:hypothetical protein [Chloroflexota bacterium]
MTSGKRADICLLPDVVDRRLEA